MDRGLEERVRTSAFDAIRRAQSMHGEVLRTDEIPRAVVDGRSVAIFNLYSGIHRPAVLDAAIAVNTAPPKPGKERPYEDQFGRDGLFHYAYRDPKSSTPKAAAQARADNAAVRAAFEQTLPIIYWFGVVPGRYRPFFPVYVAGDDPTSRVFSLDLTELGVRPQDTIASDEGTRSYRTHLVKARMHQARFREAVLRAYHQACSVCRLELPRLVEAAHIVSDAEGGEPVVPNGMALCKIHHAAFDAHILGVRPDLRIVINKDVLQQVDGPMLRHGLQEFHGQELDVVPRRIADRPGAEFLTRRWERFESAG